MLQKLIAEIEKGGTLNAAALANRLQVSPSLVEMMLEDLERRGKLARLSSNCSSDACGDCPTASKSACAPRVWALK